MSSPAKESMSTLHGCHLGLMQLRKFIWCTQCIGDNGLGHTSNSRLDCQHATIPEFLQ